MSNSTTVSPQMVQTIVQQYFAASRSPHKADSMADCFAETCIHQDPAEAPILKSRDEVRQFLQAIVDLFVSVELTEEFVSINGQAAAVKWRGHGISKNGAEVHFEGIDVFEINADGMIQTLKAYWNPSTMLAQLQEKQ
ncbi:nuclear transport factor 2 family protein [Leptolyngbya boryana CZ1]|uniref:Nuclear transport factor 2 family protein n=1 Tax=Leptolyngbya boryana CZ1 TaxID=3060204 RepID=A0AA96X9M9_LEPBY|nr:nuclear transport factor 2 family protein [Leptolyngbya boryana]WNZ48080.1 nuclear transport factor 2 family protein [Leptolyngbya boryana CZ1]